MTEHHESYPDTHHDTYSKTVFGFWVYILTDFILFAALFAVYAVLHDSTFGGPSGRELFNLPMVLVRTIVLLTASFTSGLGGVAAHRKNTLWTAIWFGVTAILGIVFLVMQLGEYAGYVAAGHGWDQSAFLSSFFSLIGTHSAHLVFAILWTLVLMPLIFIRKLDSVILRRLTCLKMFWQFLNILWIFIFTLVYLLGGELA